MDTPVFEERQAIRWVPLLILLAVAVAFVGTLQQKELRQSDVIGLSITPLAGLLAAFGFSRMITIVTVSELRFGFPFWRKRLALTEVAVGEIETIKFWYGIGIHGIGGMWVYNAHLGRGVKVRAGNTTYLIGSREPERLQNALMQHARRRVTLRWRLLKPAATCVSAGRRNCRW